MRYMHRNNIVNSLVESFSWAHRVVYSCCLGPAVQGL